jgi:hypothetical protein
MEGAKEFNPPVDGLHSRLSQPILNKTLHLTRNASRFSQVSFPSGSPNTLVLSGRPVEEVP